MRISPTLAYQAIGDSISALTCGSFFKGLLWWLRGKNQPAMQETRVKSLGREDSLKEEMATHSSIVAWKIPWTEEPGGVVHGVAKGQTWLNTHMIIFLWGIREGPTKIFLYFWSNAGLDLSFSVVCPSLKATFAWAAELSWEDSSRMWEVLLTACLLSKTIHKRMPCGHGDLWKRDCLVLIHPYPCQNWLSLFWLCLSLRVWSRILLWIWIHWESFHVLTVHLYIFSREMSIQVLCSFKNWVICTFCWILNPHMWFIR